MKASALFYAVTMVLLVGLVSCSMLWMSRHRSGQVEHWLLRERLASNARSAAFAALCGKENIFDDAWSDLFGNGGDSVRCVRLPFGWLDIVRAEAKGHGEQVALTAFAGSALKDQWVLQVDERSGALHMSGDARIHGDVCVPQGDVRRGYIDGRSFSGERLVEGRILSAPGALAPLRDDLDERLHALCAGRSLLEESTWTQSTRNDGLLTVPVVELHGASRLEGVVLEGPMIVRCSDTLTISSDSRLRMALVLAPNLIIEPGADLTIQCFVTSGIDVGPGARLRYPSLLALERDGRSAPNAGIVIREDALVQGAVVVQDRNAEGPKRPCLRLDEGAVVEGEVHATGGVEIRGAVKGTTEVGELVVRTASSRYHGYLLDGVIGPYPYTDRWGFGCSTSGERRNILSWGAVVHTKAGS